MTLGEKQRLFTLMIAKLIQYAYDQGYELTFSDAYRSPRVFGKVGVKKGYGRSKSLHKMRLAVDLNLFKDGAYLSETEDHRFLGEFWEQLNPEASWGGHFNDGNHYSLRHRGMR